MTTYTVTITFTFDERKVEIPAESEQDARDLAWSRLSDEDKAKVRNIEAEEA